MKQWAFNCLVAFDQFCNALFLGKPDETISARASTARRDGRLWGCLLCNFLDRINPGHCADAVSSDEARAETVIEDLK